MAKTSEKLLDMAVPADRLEAAIQDLQRFRDDWEKQGFPATVEGSMRSLVPHPLIKMIRDAEKAVELLSRPASAKRGGRPVGASSAPDRRPRLKVVGE